MDKSPKSKLCKHPGCRKQAKFNYEGETEGLYCKDHMLTGMFNVVDKKCEHTGCRKIPKFNYDGETKGLYCKDHMLPGMVNVKNRRCIKNTQINYEGEEGHRKCEHSGCKKRSYFNYEGEKQALYCKDHMLPGMVNVKSRKCEHPGCRKRPLFNYEGETQGLYCKDHMLPGMVNVVDKKCKHPGCRKRPLFNYEGDTRGLYCKDHMLPGMVNIKHIRNNPKCEKHKHDKYKETVKEFLLSKGITFESYDSKIQDSKYRPDFVIDYGTFKVIIEVDENQHSEYSRMCSIHSDFGGVPILFLRYNPDTYHIKGESIRSNDNYRLTKLFEILTQLRNVEIIKYPLLVCYLFYDEFDGILRFYTIDYYNNNINEVQDVFLYKKS